MIQASQNMGDFAAMLNAMRPGYHPANRADPVWVERWRTAYEGCTDGEVPLLDTAEAQMEPAFA